jgi:hypothetical protein
MTIHIENNLRFFSRVFWAESGIVLANVLNYCPSFQCMQCAKILMSICVDSCLCQLFFRLQSQFYDRFSCMVRDVWATFIFLHFLLCSLLLVLKALHACLSNVAPRAIRTVNLINYVRLIFWWWSVFSRREYLL